MDQHNECRQLCSGLANTGKLEGHLYELKCHQLWPRGGTGNLGRKGGKGTVVPVTLRPLPHWIQVLQVLGTSDSHFTFYIFKIMKWKASFCILSKMKSPSGSTDIVDSLAPLGRMQRFRNDFPSFCFVLFPFVCLIPEYLFLFNMCLCGEEGSTYMLLKCSV